MNWTKLTIAYLIVPFLFFCIGFLRWYVGIPMALFSVYCAYKVGEKQFKAQDILSWKQHLVLAFVAMLWCWHCGIGGFWVQHADFFVKNAIFRDLMNRPWPLRYDLSTLSEEVQSLIGSDQVGFAYYLFIYLPAAFCGWLFHSDLVGNVALLVWSAIGVYLVLNFLINFSCQKRPSNKVLGGLLIAILCFSGMEVLGPPLLDLFMGNNVLAHSWSNIQSLSIAKEMWCWPYFSMYGSLYSDMEIRFNQTIPIWCVMALILQSKENIRYIGFYFSFLLLYSPWACVGGTLMVLYVVGYDALKNGLVAVRNQMSVANIVFPLLVAVIVGSFYRSNQNSTSYQGWYFEFISHREFFIKYILFLLIEIGAYFIILKSKLSTNPLLQSAFLLLLILPFYQITESNDLLMCASIPAIFVIASIWFKWLRENFLYRWRFVIVVFLFLSALTPIEWFIAEDYHYLSGKTEKIKDYIYSFSDIEGGSATLCDQQFFVHNPQETFFWKYLAK